VREISDDEGNRLKRNEQFSTTRLRPGYEEEEVDVFLDEAESRLAAQPGARREASGAGTEAGAADPAAEAVQIRCLECAADSAEAAEVCARCGAPVAYQRSVAAATAPATGQTPPEPYVPGRGDKVPARLRRVPRGYSWMAWGAVFGGWALVAVGGYFQELSSPSDRWFFLAGIVPGVLAAVLFGQHIRWALFFRRPAPASSATVTACQHGGRMLMLDAPCDGYPSGLKVRLAWWAEPEMLLPGEKVTFYGRLTARFALQPGELAVGVPPVMTGSGPLYAGPRTSLSRLFRGTCPR